MSEIPNGANQVQASDGRWYPASAFDSTGYPPPAYAPPAYSSGPSPYPAAGPTTNDKATISLILGILGLVSCYALTGIPAIILARMAQREIDASGGAEEGRAMATTGLVLGVIATALTTIMLLALVAVLALGSTIDTDDDLDERPTVTVSVPR